MADLTPVHSLASAQSGGMAPTGASRSPQHQRSSGSAAGGTLSPQASGVPATPLCVRSPLNTSMSRSPGARPTLPSPQALPEALDTPVPAASSQLLADVENRATSSARVVDGASADPPKAAITSPAAESWQQAEVASNRTSNTTEDTDERVASNSPADGIASPGGESGNPDEDEWEEPSVLPFVYLPRSKVRLSLNHQFWGFAIALLVAVCFECMMLTVDTWRYPDPVTQKQLPDFALDLLPEVPVLEHATDALLGTLVVSALGTVAVLYLIGQGKYAPVDAKLLRKFAPAETLYQTAWIRFFVTFLCLTWLRVIVLIGTVLPATNNKCRTRPDTGSFWWNAFVGVVTVGSGSVHCGDLLFSGHTVVVTLSACALITYGPIVSKYLKPLAMVFTVLTWFTILMSRSHYTDDIIIAFYMTITAWALVGHSPRGAPPILQLIIQSPCRTWSLIQEAKAERAAQRAEREQAPQVIVSY